MTRTKLIGQIIDGESISSPFFGEMTGSSTVLKEVSSGTGDIEVYINSVGGNCMAGFEIVNSFRSAITAGRNVTFYIGSLAASIAAYIPTAVEGAKIVIAENAKMAFHAPWSSMTGSREEFQDEIELLSKIENDVKSALQKRGVQVSDEWFKAGRVKWFSGKEAVEAHIADSIGVAPNDLLKTISEKSKESSASISEWWEDRVKISAKMSFEGYIKYLCQEKYGEDADIKMLGDKKFLLFYGKNKKEKLLLNYTIDCNNMISVDWKSTAKEGEKMNPENIQAATPQNKTTPENTATATASAVVQPVASVTPSAVPADSVHTTTVTPVADSAHHADSADDLTPDMKSFARKNYTAARDSYIQKIENSKFNKFAKDELEKFGIDVLEKMASLVSDEQIAGKTENSVSAPKASVLPVVTVTDSSEEGSLIPPEY